MIKLALQLVRVTNTATLSAVVNASFFYTLLLFVAAILNLDLGGWLRDDKISKYSLSISVKRFRCKIEFEFFDYQKFLAKFFIFRSFPSDSSFEK